VEDYMLCIDCVSAEDGDCARNGHPTQGTSYLNCGGEEFGKTKFVVNWSFAELYAVLHVEAKTKEEALLAFLERFKEDIPEIHRGTNTRNEGVVVRALDEILAYSWLTDNIRATYWKGHGYSRWFGEYIYDF
jgi:hypothetical protein